MQLYSEGELGFDQAFYRYSIFKPDGFGIGACGVRQIVLCGWQNLRVLSLGNTAVIKVTIELETQAAVAESVLMVST